MLLELWADLEHFIELYGIWAVAGSVFLEAFGAPVPAESLLIAAGVLASDGKISLAPLMVTAWIGAVAGDNVGYCIGRYGGRRLLIKFGKYIFITDENLAYVERFFTRFGGPVVLFARFFAILRQLNGIVAGTSLMPYPKFMLYNALGAFLWVGVWTSGAFLMGHQIEVGLTHFKSGEPIFIGIYVAIFAVVLVLGYRRWKHKRAQKAEAGKD